VSDSLAASAVPLPQEPNPSASNGSAGAPAQPVAEGSATSAAASGGPAGVGGTAAAQLQRAAEAESLTEQGIHLCRTARWRSAIEPLRRATELDPTHAMAFYYLGDACNHADELAHALEAFEAASRLEPDHWRALKGIGIVLDRMRRPQEAAAAYQRAREAQHKATPRQS
jgi:Flp pilus assembly protein TadD